MILIMILSTLIMMVLVIQSKRMVEVVKVMQYQLLNKKFVLPRMGVKKLITKLVVLLIYYEESPCDLAIASG